jgi:anti-sigma factor RsiW
MHCSDLERYLEACLDGQLGDSRRRALKDHLGFCGSCRERVDGLRRFEADLQRRLRAMQHEASLWQPLGLEAVTTAPPARRLVPASLPAAEPAVAASGGLLARRGHRLRAAAAGGAAPVAPGGIGRRLQGIAGIALLVAAAGAVAELTITGLSWLGGDRRAAVYRAYVDGDVKLDLRTAEPGRLSYWLAEQLGGPVSLPATPGGFTLFGGAAALEGAPDQAAMAVYTTASGPALLLIEAAIAGGDGTLGESKVVVESGLARLDWQDGGHAYSLIGALPPDKLALFAD